MGTFWLYTSQNTPHLHYCFHFRDAEGPYTTVIKKWLKRKVWLNTFPVIWEHGIISEIMNRNAAKWGLQPVWMLHLQDSGFTDAALWVSSKENTSFWEILPKKESSKTSAKKFKLSENTARTQPFAWQDVTWSFQEHNSYF